MKVSDVFKKRAIFGAAIFCITAIATVGALSIGGKEEDNAPDSLVDLNGTDSQGEENQKTADNTKEQESVENPFQTAQQSGMEEVTQTAEHSGSEEATQTAEQTGMEEVVQTAEEGKDIPQQMAEQVQTQNPETEQEGTSAVASDVPNEQEALTEVLNPQLIAEQLNFDKSAGLMWPVQGDIVIPYSPDHGVYHYTLDQFGTSEAVVLSSAVGTQVKAAAKGVVTAIEEDVRTGTTVTLALGNDTTLVYGQLDVADLKEGDVVEAGECLGTVAEPTRYYVVEGPNLYFQVFEGEESIDPSMLLQGE